MKKTISIILALLLVFGALPLSLIAESGASEPKERAALSAKPALDEGEGLRQINTNSIAIDNDPEGGYEGDYVVIYNPSETSGSSMSTGNMSGLIDTSITANMMPGDYVEETIEDDTPYIIDVDAYMEELAEKLRGEEIEPAEPVRASYNVGDTKTFTVMNNITLNNPPRVAIQFELLHKGDHCYIWTPAGTNTYPVELCPITASLAASAAEEFDAKYELMNSSFGSHNSGSGDGRVNFLYYNLNDGAGANDAYTAGYFWSYDYTLNSLPVMHIDTFPGVYSSISDAGTDNGPRLSNSFGTMVHEYQHMINYSRTGGSATWINETMSAGAEELCYPGSSIFGRIRSYTACANTYDALLNPVKEYAASRPNLHNGYSMYAWDQNISDSLSLYAQVSLFSQYLYTQYPQGNEVFSAILTELAKGKTFQEACPIVLGMSSSDFVRNFRIAMTANTSQNVLDGKYGWVLQPGYDPSSYYGVANPYNILGPIIHQSNSCSIKGGGAITIKPVGGAYTPPAGADEGLRYYGIKLNASGGDIGDEQQPPEMGMKFKKSVRTEQDGTFTVVAEAYYAGEGCPYTSSYYILDSINRTNYTGHAYSNSLSYEFYACTGIGLDGKYTFSETPVASVSGSNVATDLYTNITEITGIDWAANACKQSGGGYQGYKFVYYHKNVVFNDANSPTFSVTPGSYPVLGEYNWFGTLNGNSATVSCYIPDAEVTINDRYTVYDFGTPFICGDEEFNGAVAFSSRAQKLTNTTASYSQDGASGAASISGGNLTFTPSSLSTSFTSALTLLRLTDGSYEWSKLTFLPATVVMFEETAGIYSSEWMEAEPVFSEPVNISGVYGYSEGYAANTGDSNDTAKSVIVNSELYEAVKSGSAQWPNAQFVFTGTGADIIARAGTDTGVFAIDLVPYGKEYSFTGANSVHMIIDTYYPDATLYQVPVLHETELAHGTYMIRVRALYSPMMDHQSVSVSGVTSFPGLENVSYEYVRLCENAKETVRDHGAFTAYIDGLRVYNPIDTSDAANAGAAEAHTAAGELDPRFLNVKHLITSTAPDGQSALYLNLNSEEQTAEAVQYVDMNPNTEVYVRPGGGVAFSVSGEYGSIHLSARSPIGKSVKLKVNGHEITLSHTTELYYDITEYAEGSSFSITCEADGSASDAILSLLNVKLLPASGTASSPRIVADEQLIEFAAAMNFGVAGDADHDGEVTVTDALTVMRSVLGSVELGSYGSICTDVDGSGTVNVLDALAIIRIALGII